MLNIQLSAKTRAELRKKNNKLRAKNILPAVIYGAGVENKNISIDYKEFAKAFDKAGVSTMIDLKIDDTEPIKVLVHDFQKDSLRDTFMHVDFYAIDVNKELIVNVTLNLDNIETAEKATGGEVIRGLDALHVKCLPKDLIREINVDVSKYLKQLGDVLHAKDLPLSEGLNLAIDGETAIVSLQEIKQPTEEDEVKSVEETENGEAVDDKEDKEGESKKDENKKSAEDEGGKKKE